jgi:adenylate cyclase
MADVLEMLFGKKVHGTRVVPLMVKIVMIFTIFLLVSNFTSNYINLILNRGEQIRLLNQLLVKDLRALHVFATNQHEIYTFNENLEEAVHNLRSRGAREFQGKNSLAMGIHPDGDVLFNASPFEDLSVFPDDDTLEKMTEDFESGLEDGAFNFVIEGQQYFGVYKYHSRWDAFILRAEELGEFYADSSRIFREVTVIILLITMLCVLVGVFLIRYILRFVSIITSSIMKMQDTQSIDLLDMAGAPNDDVTYLGVAFNSLASTIDNLMNIFKKFVARDVAARAYEEREIRLEGTKRELTILFTDIKSFTFMTEVLGTDIIKLLNLHYDKAIRHIHRHNGDIGSIIGDALLAVFGAMKDVEENKSYQALNSAYLIQDVASELRTEMHTRRERILEQRGSLTEAEEAVYKAVLIEVGVGIDGGEVFYGNIGSYERMVNTVIGDNVNSAARLEGLTRLYRIPVICSEYVKTEVERDFQEYRFLEIDTVQVKGKTIGKKVFWPIKTEHLDDTLLKDVELYTEGLKLYYQGDWQKAGSFFSDCTLPAAEVFKTRVSTTTCPKDWNGIWTMKEK